MKERESKISRVSVRDIAEAAGVSKTTVGFVLRNLAGPSKKTRERIRQIASELGYVPDARINSWMARVRAAKAKELLPIAWLTTESDRDAWHKYNFLAPYWNGMSERCEELGYRLEEIWTHQPNMTMRRISQILYQRGIEGVVITPPARHIQLNWNNLAGVALGTELLGPRLHRVGHNFLFNLRLALKTLRRSGYQRIGVCLTTAINRNSDGMASALACHLASTSPESKLVSPLFYKGTGEGPIPRKLFRAWLRRHKPDVIVGLDGRLLDWVEEEGRRVPQEVAIVHLALDDDVLDWAGVYANKKEVGRTAAELVISLVCNRQFGVPQSALDTMIRGSWHNGRTLLIPKPK
jgi:LacI family transcriptional regulator